jgi:hypothetical protein
MGVISGRDPGPGKAKPSSDVWDTKKVAPSGGLTEKQLVWRISEDGATGVCWE